MRLPAIFLCCWFVQYRLCLLFMARPLTYPHRRLLQLDDQLKEKIDDFRFSRRYKTEADAIRALIQAGLDATAGKQPSHEPSKERQQLSKPQQAQSIELEYTPDDATQTGPHSRHRR